jgi:hypothetical protein
MTRFLPIKTRFLPTHRTKFKRFCANKKIRTSKKKENEMKDVDLDEVNTCPHDKYFEDCDDCLDKEILRLRNLIEEQENIIVDNCNFCKAH